MNELIVSAVVAGEEWPLDLKKTTQILFEAKGSFYFGKIKRSGDSADVSFWVHWEEPSTGNDYFEVRYERQQDRSWRISEILVNDEIEKAKFARTGSYRNMSTVGFVRFSLGSTLSTFDSFEYLVIEALHGSSIEYEISPLNFIPLAYLSGAHGDAVDDKTPLYNFRSVANGLAWSLSAFLAGTNITNVREVLDSPWHYAFFAPDCRVRVRIAGKLNFLVGTRTDYMLYRTATTERGIAFTPHIGLDVSGGDFGESVGYGGLSISVGYRNWLNFDGDSYSGELALLVALWGYPDTP